MKCVILKVEAYSIHTHWFSSRTHWTDAHYFEINRHSSKLVDATVITSKLCDESNI